MVLESSRISVLKSKSGGGGLIETLEGFRGFLERQNGLVVKMGKDDLRVSMDENEKAMWVFCDSQKCECS